MKASELRIGNFYDHNGFVNEVNPNTIEEAWIAERSWIKPIPLTEVWLWNFGFEKTEWDNFNSFRRTIGNNDYAIILYSDGNCEVGDIITCKIEYVHQLQNLYFALTGEELIRKSEK
jgi:hypothetical protein